jgi:hypothetical protein
MIRDVDAGVGVNECAFRGNHLIPGAPHNNADIVMKVNAIELRVACNIISIKSQLVALSRLRVVGLIIG